MQQESSSGVHGFGQQALRVGGIAGIGPQPPQPIVLRQVGNGANQRHAQTLDDFFGGVDLARLKFDPGEGEQDENQRAARRARREQQFALGGIGRVDGSIAELSDPRRPIRSISMASIFLLARSMTSSAFLISSLISARSTATLFFSPCLLVQLLNRLRENLLQRQGRRVTLSDGGGGIDLGASRLSRIPSRLPLGVIIDVGPEGIQFLLVFLDCFANFAGWAFFRYPSITPSSLFISLMSSLTIGSIASRSAMSSPALRPETRNSSCSRPTSVELKGETEAGEVFRTATN